MCRVHFYIVSKVESDIIHMIRTALLNIIMLRSDKHGSLYTHIFLFSNIALDASSNSPANGLKEDLALQPANSITSYKLHFIFLASLLQDHVIIASCLHVEISVVSSMVIEKTNALTYPSSFSGNGLLKHFNNTFHLCWLTLNMRSYFRVWTQNR